MPKLAKRLKPTGETLRELFLKSGNLCAFPGCSALMMNADGLFIGQICHIEAAEDGGERFNKLMTNEERRSAPNLVLLCYPHHVQTDDVIVFTVEKLQRIKKDHEMRFSDPNVLLKSFRDWTESYSATEAKNLQRISEVLKWGNASLEELSTSVTELASYTQSLKDVPLEVRIFLGAVIQRAYKMAQQRVVKDSLGGVSILISDLRGAFNLTSESIVQLVQQLEAYSLGDLDSVDTDLGVVGAVRIRHLKSGWKLWLEIAEFCELENESLATFIEQLDFSRLDRKDPDILYI